MQNGTASDQQLDYFKKHNNTSIPYCMQITAPKEGSHVVIVGGTHGNEPSGVAATVEVHKQLFDGKIVLDSGKISFVLGNPEAYRHTVRYLDRDLNRAFGDQDHSTVEGKRAATIKQYLREELDISAVLDLHSVSRGDFRIAVYNKKIPENVDLTMRISPIPLHFAYHEEHMPGTLVDEAHRHRVPGVIIECGNHESERAKDTAVEHIHNLLTFYGLIDKRSLPSNSAPFRPSNIIQYESIQAIQPHENFRFLVEDVTTGTKLDQGQRFAVDDQGYHFAPEDCYVVVPSKQVGPNDRDAGFLCRLNALHFQGMKQHF